MKNSNIVYSGLIENTDALNLTRLRTKLYAEYLSNIYDAQLNNSNDVIFLDALTEIQKNGMLFVDVGPDEEGFDLCYAPSKNAIEKTLKGVGSWPANLSKQLKKSLRISEGAIFQFRDEDGKASLDVFITDWSPCAGACAVAIHQSHPWLAQCEQVSDAEDYFTGSYVRHPLTGDLLPVWVAGWVKADFGTGAVLINPAHSEVDYQYGRRMGFPVRFALMPEGRSSDPQSWPNAPVIKTGFSIKTGQLDALSAGDMQTKTFEILKQRNLAEAFTDKKIPGFSLGKAIESPVGAYVLNISTAQLTAYRDGQIISPVEKRVTFTSSDCLQIFAGLTEKKPEFLLVSEPEFKEFGLYLLLLLCEFGSEQVVPDLKLIKEVSYSGNRKIDAGIKLACLVAEEPDRPVVIRKQLLTQLDQSLETIQKIRGSYLSDEGEQAPAQIQTQIERGDLISGFRSFNKWQKDCLKSEKKISKESYLKISNAMFGDWIADV